MAVTLSYKDFGIDKRYLDQKSIITSLCKRNRIVLGLKHFFCTLSDVTLVAH